MLRRNYFTSCLFVILLCVSPASVSAGIFDDDEKNWERVFIELKKINARLVALETEKLRTLQAVQEDLLRQLEEIKGTIPDLRGVIEQNKAEMVSRVNGLDTKLRDLEAHLKNEILKEIKNQSLATENTLTALTTQSEQIQNKLADEMEQLAQKNKEYFLDFSKGNEESLKKVVDHLNTQNQTLEQTKSFFTTELIPAIQAQGDKNRAQAENNSQMLTARLSETNENTQRGFKNNQDALVSGFNTIEERNKKLIEILSLSLKENQAVKGQVEQVNSNLAKTNENIHLNFENLAKLRLAFTDELQILSKNQKALQEKVEAGVKGTDLANKNLLVADQKVNQVAEGIKALHAHNVATTDSLASLKEGLGLVREFNLAAADQLSLLSNSSNFLSAQTTELEKKLNETLEKSSANEASLNLANQKLARLIEILKTLAAEQGKIDQVLAGQTKMDKILAGQTRIDQGIQKQQKTAATQDKVDRLIKTQSEIKEALTDLRRKANVNISRNDEIQKALSNLKKSKATSP